MLLLLVARAEDAAVDQENRDYVCQDDDDGKMTSLVSLQIQPITPMIAKLKTG